jgi:hypothetical protein
VWERNAETQNDETTPHTSLGTDTVELYSYIWMASIIITFHVKFIYQAGLKTDLRILEELISRSHSANSVVWHLSYSLYSRKTA